jgi:transposase
MFVGVDVHKHSLYVCYYRRATDYRFQSYPFTRDGFRQFLGSLIPHDEVAIESVTQAYYLVDQLRPKVKRVVVVNTFAFDLIKRSRSKTDQKDAFHLAEQLSHGHLPEVQLPDRTVRDLRSYQSARVALIEERTRLKNRIHAAFLMHGIVTARRDLESQKGGARLRGESQQYVGYPEMELVGMHLDRIDEIERRAKGIDERMRRCATGLTDLPRLLEVQGIGVLLGMTILAEVGDFRRFGTATKLSSYAGLVPSTRRSAGWTRAGRTGYGRKRLRTALVQAVRTLTVHDPSNPLAVHYRLLRARRGPGRATVATARKLLEILWIMVTTDVPYRQLVPELHRHKVQQLQREAA